MARKMSIILGLIAALLIAGCGSGSQPSAVSPSQEPKVSTEAEETTYQPEQSEEESQSEPGGPLADLGTITGSDGEGTTFRDDYSVGPLLYSKEGSPPEEVLAACSLTDSSVIARSVFARGQVTIAYQQGTLPTEVVLGSSTPVVGGLYTFVAFHSAGKWWCTQSEGFALHFQPRESQTFPIWIIAPQALSNAQPRVPTSTLNTWYFNLIAPTTLRNVKVHGPGAGLCDEASGNVERLLLYNRSGSC